MLKEILKNIMPPYLLRLLTRFRCIWRGNYANWEAAQAASHGYDTEVILNRVKGAALKVKSNTAVYERDSVLFDKIQYSLPILAGILLAGYKASVVNVLDYGGSLGTTFYQNKKFLDCLNAVSWNIVEQEKIVACGRQLFETDNIKFFYSLEEYLKNNTPTVILLSSVLQYIQEPFALLKRLCACKASVLVIDRSTFSTAGKPKIVVQHVPRSIYPASYPCWLFNEEELTHFVNNHGYSLVEEFAGNNYGKCYEKGFIFKLT